MGPDFERFDWSVVSAPALQLSPMFALLWLISALASQIEKVAEQRNPNFAPSSSSSSKCSSSSSSTRECHRDDYCCDSSSDCNQCCPDFQDELVFLRHDVGFYHFDFPAGNSDALAFRTFYTNFPYFTQMTVLDCLCNGDRFYVKIDNGSSNFAAITNGGEFSTECEYYEENPFNCLMTDLNIFARTAPIIIPPGFWNISIIPTNTPYLAGTGYIILQYPSDQDPVSQPACLYPYSIYYPCEWTIFD